MGVKFRTVKPQPTAPESPSALRRLLAGAARVGGGLYPGGGPIGAALAGGAEGLAELIEGDVPDIARMGVEAGIGAVPLAKYIKGGRALASALKTGALTGVGEAGREIAKGEELSPGSIALATGLGGVTGGAIGKFTSGAPGAPKLPTRPEGPQTLAKFLKTKSPKDIESFALKAHAQGMPEVAEDVRRIATETGQASPVTMNRLIRIQEAARKASEKQATQLASATRIAQAREGLVPKRAVSETISAEVPGGKETLKTIFAKPKEKRAPSLTKIRDIPPEGTPARGIYDEWIAAGRDPKTALRLAIAGRQRLVTPPTTEAVEEITTEIPRALPRTPEEVEAYLAEKTVPEALGAPRSPLAEMLGPRPSPVTEAVPEATIGPREAILEQTRPAIETLEEIQELSGGAGARAAAEMMPPAAVPEVPQQELSVLQRLLSGQTLPEGPRMAPPMKRAEAIAKAKREFPPEVNQRLEELGRAYDMATGVEKRAIGAMMRQTEAEARGLSKEVTERPLGAGAPPRVKRSGPPSKMTTSQAQQGIADEAEKLLAEGVPEEEALERAKQSFLDRLKGMKGGEAGAINPEALTTLGMGALGALVGGATDPLDNPLASAALGAGAGISIPSIVKGLQSLGASNESLMGIEGQLSTPEGIIEVARKVGRTLPQIQRFNFLADAWGLPANAFVGPYGSALMGSLTKALSGDPRGWEALRTLRDPRNFMDEFLKGRQEALELIRRGEGGRGETEFLSEGIPSAILQGPGTLMTSGDVAARRILMGAGFTEDEARVMTLTGEPELPFFRAVAETGKRSPLMRFLFPFRRTPANIGEQGSLRIPGLGSIVQSMRQGLGSAPDPLKEQLVQQALGAGTGLGGFAIGANVDPETARFIRRYVTNVSGQYSLPTSIGFAAGQAVEQGRPIVSRPTLQAIEQALPLPTAEPLTDIISTVAGEGRIPRGMVPAQVHELLYPRTEESLRPLSSRLRFRSLP